MSTGKPRFILPGITSYFGGKGAPATVRRIINALPAHHVYIEPFLGSGRVLRHKRPAPGGSFGFETDPALCATWHTCAPVDVHIVNTDALTSLEPLILALMEAGCPPEQIVTYCDPPYLMHTRRSSNLVYHREWCAEDHVKFLLLARRLPGRVLISHLPCAEYATALADWHTFTFLNSTRHGLQTEQVWCNFTPGPELHEYTFIGRDFRERERFKRQFAIIRKRFHALPPAARIALLGMLDAHDHSDNRSSSTHPTP